MIHPNLSIHDGFSCEVLLSLSSGLFRGLGVNASYNLYSEPAVACVSSFVLSDSAHNLTELFV